MIIAIVILALRKKKRLFGNFPKWQISPYPFLLRERGRLVLQLLGKLPQSERKERKETEEIEEIDDVPGMSPRCH